MAHVHESLRIPGDYTVDQGRGFEWWGSDYAQRIWSDLGNFHNASTLYRLHCEIDFLRGNGHAAEAGPAMLDLMSEGGLSAIVYDAEKDLFKFHCSVYAHYDNEAWVRRVFNAAVALQVGEVHRHAQRFARDFKLSHAMSEHPRSGARKEPDPICHYEAQFFRPHGQGVSRWQGSEEWDEGRQMLRRIARDVHTDDNLTLEAAFDWNYGPRDMTLVISAVDAHPELGFGLMACLTAPLDADSAQLAKAAHGLNEIERRDWNWYNDLGSWSVRGGELVFVCFVPNICHTKGILPDMAHDMGLRANWVHEHWPRVAQS